MMMFFGHPVKSFNLEITNRCRLKCSGCARTNNDEIIKKPTDLSLQQLAHIFTHEDPDFFDGIRLNLCGVYGDCIYHPQFHDVIALLKERKFILNIETNGSFKDQNWWQKLAHILRPQDSITFSIDGLADTNAVYRVNSRWNDIMLAIESVRGSAKIVWKFIVFSHNQHQVEPARKFAADIGVSEFIVKYSGRFTTADPLRPDDESFVGIESFTKEALQSDKHDLALTPRCQNGKNLGISFTGHLYPCCTASTKTQGWFQDNLAFRDLNKHTLIQVLNDPRWNELHKLWEDPATAPQICQEYCGIVKHKFANPAAGLFKQRDRHITSLK